MKTKKYLYTALLTIALLTFTLQVYIFQAPNGTVGFILCTLCVYAIVFSLVRLCQMSESFKNGLFKVVKTIFWIP